jgi:hypothetical protein
MVDATCRALLDGQPRAAVPTSFLLAPPFFLLGWICLGGCGKLVAMKKQASDQSFHDRRYQERKRAEAERKVPKKKVVKVTESRVGR